MPAGSVDWDGLLAEYQLGVPDPARRAQWAAQHGQSRGACPDEVRAVIQVLAQRLAWWLEQVVEGDPDDSAGQSRLHQLRARQRRLVEEATDTYEAAVLPARPAALGGIFAAANRTASPSHPAKQRQHAQLIFKCNHCGAPQQGITEFVCAYCRRPLFG